MTAPAPAQPPTAQSATLCPYCGTGCGLRVETSARRVLAVSGDRAHPVNEGRICRKPTELGSAVHAPDRALTPLMRTSSRLPFEEAGWNDALGRVASELTRIRARHGPRAIAFYISGQLLTEDYYAANKLAKGLIGTNNVDSNSRLCMSSAVAGYNGAFGSDGPPPAYADIDRTDCMLLLGSNAAACHPILFARIRARQAQGAKLIVADPRRTPTAEAADLHLAVRPGTDLPLLNAMLAVIDSAGLLDETFVREHTTDFERAIETAREWSPARAAGICGIPAEQITRAAELFGAAGAAMTLWSMGANQSTVGTLKNRALINLCLATGNLGREGSGPLSLTGQPNAMGGREVGGLAHLLPGYRKVADPGDRAEVEAHWGLAPGSIAPEPGLSAVEVVDGLLDGRIKAVLVAATNPIVSLPDGGRVREAFERAELLVVQDCHHPTETSALAHVVLPAAAWPEKEGTMTNSERRVGLVRKLIDPPGLAREDWWIYAELARHMGHGRGFRWRDSSAVYDEWAALTAGRPCDVSAVSHERLREQGSVQWPCPAEGEVAPAGTERLYAERRVATADGRSRFASTPHSGPADAPDAEFPLMLTTGRLADQWHTMSRTGKSPALRAAAGKAAVSVHPADAARLGVAAGRPALVRSRRGEAVLEVLLDGSLPEGVAFAPFHWGALHAAPGSGALNMLGHASVDPTSGQPELKAIAVSLAPLAPGGAARRRRRARRHLVVIGTGMAGLATVEEVLRRDPAGWRVTMLGREPGPVYNRILLSRLLAGDCTPGDLEIRPLQWYADNDVDLRGGCPATAIDHSTRRVIDSAGGEHIYDALVIATGSNAFVPPIPGSELPRVGVFRTWADTEALRDAPAMGRRVVVLGGGLLGLEAAAGMRRRGARVEVVEPAPRLMGRQLDEAAAGMLAEALTARGIGIRLGVCAKEIRLRSVLLDDGERIEADQVVIAAGIRPETRLAAEAGLRVERGIVVDDTMRADGEGIWAVGECMQHRDVLYGLWAPLAEAARVAGADIAGDPGAFRPTATATVLKIAGVELYAGGSMERAPEREEVTFTDTRRGLYRRMILEDDRLVGAILVGDVSDAPRCTAALQSDDAVAESLLVAGGGDAPAASDPERVVCHCHRLTAARIESAIAGEGLATLAEVAARTGASTGCGGCSGEVRGLLEAAGPGQGGSSDRNMDDVPAKSAPGTMLA